MGSNESLMAELSPEEVNHLVTTTKFTEHEIRSLYSRFRQVSSAIVDDGKIDVDEFKQSLGLPNTDIANRIFSAFDTDGSKDIDFSEFAQGLYALSPRASIEEKAKFCFYIYDIDKNGSIERDELKEVLTMSLKLNKSVRLTDAQLDKIIDSTFRRIDANNDNQIQFDEFLAEAKRNPSMLNCVSLDCDKIFSSAMTEQ